MFPLPSEVAPLTSPVQCLDVIGSGRTLVSTRELNREKPRTEGRKRGSRWRCLSSRRKPCLTEAGRLRLPHAVCSRSELGASGLVLRPGMEIAPAHTPPAPWASVDFPLWTGLGLVRLRLHGSLTQGTASPPSPVSRHLERCSWALAWKPGLTLLFRWLWPTSCHPRASGPGG